MDGAIKSFISLVNDVKDNIVTQEQIETLYGTDVYERIKQHLQMEAVDYPAFPLAA